MPRSPSPYGQRDRPDRRRYDDRDDDRAPRYPDGRDGRGEGSSGRRRRDERDDRERARERRGRSRSRSRSPAPRQRSRSPRSRSRSRSRDRSSRHHRDRRRSRSSSSSSSSGEDDRQRKKHRHRRDRSRDKESKEERRERKRLKKKRKEEKKAKKANKSGKGAIGEYGKYGIISEIDIYTKDAEFRAWLVEEKMLNPETVAPAKSKELFRTFMEDFNTGTLPHEKFYALEAYERRMNAIKAGETVAEAGSYDPRADELALAAAGRRSTKAPGETYLAREQLEALRKVERERVEASRMKRMGLDVKEGMGVRYE